VQPRALPGEQESGESSQGVEAGVLLLTVSVAARIAVVERPAGAVVIVWPA